MSVKRRLRRLAFRTKKKKNFHIVPFNVLEKMFEEFYMGYSVKMIAEDNDVTEATVYKYIKVGDPKRGIQPFRERRSDLLAEQLAIDNARILKIHSDVINKSSKVYNKVADRYLERLSKAADFDKKSLYGSDKFEDLALCKAKALNPDGRDYRTASDIVLKLVGGNDNKTPNVIVNQSTEVANSNNITNVNVINEFVEYCNFVSENKVDTSTFLKNISEKFEASEANE